jgi:ribonuclease R
MHEDRVLVRRDMRKNFRSGDDAQETGTVVRILERKRTQMVGTLQRSKQFLYVVPDDPRIPHDIYVSEPRDVGRPAHIGDKVVVELREWESRHTNPEGEIVEVLGAPDEEGVDMLSVLRQYDLPLHFPKNVLAEANAIGKIVHPRDEAGRVDCRAHQVITIDPDDAKDFDDAICLEKISPEQWRLWVHIADVSHYVKPGTALDAEAQKRGNSTYLVDRVIPMLPEALSNELCSLKPNVDRLTKCVEFLVSNDGRVLNTKFYSAVIHSQRRFAYGEVLEILQRAPPDDPIEQMLHQAHELAQKIRRLRFKAGSLDLDFPETKIRLDEHGKILRIEKNENDVSHQLIEEYMLLANEAVATRLMSLRTPAIYRIHEEPDARRLQEYRDEVLAHHVACGNLSQTSEVQKLLQKLGTLPIGQALKIGFLKSLMRARYAVEPLGHYGLAKKKYTHFTSPIRRYADLVVHRALFDKNAVATSALKEIADHISVTERNSADAERDSKDVKLYAFLKAQLAIRRADEISRARDRRAELRFLRGRARPRDERPGAVVADAGRFLCVRRSAAQSRWPPHAPDDPARRQTHRASRASGHVQKAGGFSTRHRGTPPAWTLIWAINVKATLPQLLASHAAPRGARQGRRLRRPVRAGRERNIASPSSCRPWTASAPSSRSPSSRTSTTPSARIS